MNTQILTKYLLLLLLFLVNGKAMSANVTESMEHGTSSYIAVDGVIVNGDMRKITALSNSFIKKGLPVKILLNSEGGDVLEAIKIGHFVRKAYVEVKIRGAYIKPSSPNLRRCYSACVLIFVASPKRDHEMDNEYFTENGGGVWEVIDGKRDLKFTPVIGIHRPYFSPAAYKNLDLDKAKNEYSRLENAVRQYLKDMGAPDSFTDDMFRFASNEIKLVSKKDFIRQFGYEMPFLEEWFLSKCGGFESKERSDWAKIVAARIVKQDDSYVPPELSIGYSDYLINKQSTVQSCKENSLQAHQRDVLKNLTQQ